MDDALIQHIKDLKKLGDRHKELVAELDQLRSPLHEAIREARQLGAKQREIMEASGYKTIQQIRTITGEAKKSGTDG